MSYQNPYESSRHGSSMHTISNESRTGSRSHSSKRTPSVIKEESINIVNIDVEVTSGDAKPDKHGTAKILDPRRVDSQVTFGKAVMKNKGKSMKDVRKSRDMSPSKIIKEDQSASPQKQSLTITSLKK